MKDVLLVDDEPGYETLVTIVLDEDDRLQFTSRRQPSADGAIETVRREPPDLIILDHFLEGETRGLEAAPLLKRVAPEAKILLFTDHPLAIEAAREPAIDAYLPKAEIHSLLPTVQHLLGLEERDAS